MRLATLINHGKEVAAIQLGDGFHALPYADVGAILRGNALGPQLEQSVVGLIGAPEAVRFAPLIARPGKIICVGLNYRSHSRELRMTEPKFPALFAKFANALIGAHDPIHMSSVTSALDWEAEMVVVVGSVRSPHTKEPPRAAIAGYTIGNDISARDLQQRTDQWLAGKTLDLSTPLGPVLVTAEEFGEFDPDLLIQSELNGEIVQEARTSDLVFTPTSLVDDVSRFCTLEPGDLIFTGTPSGVGAGRRPPRYLQDGDVLITRIETIGACRNTVVACA
jgi:acylpyruvate hydrolase